MRVWYRAGVGVVFAVFLLLFPTSLFAAVTFTFSAGAYGAICPGTNSAVMPTMLLYTTAGGTVIQNSMIQILIPPATIAGVPGLAGNPAGVTLLSVPGGVYITINFAATTTIPPNTTLTIGGLTANIPASATGTIILAMASFSGDTSVSAPLTQPVALVTSTACTSSIATSVSSLFFAVTPGLNPASQTFTITNGFQPGTNLTPSVTATSTPMGWLAVVVGTENYGLTTVTVQVSSSGLTEGSYTGDITVSSTMVQNPAVDIPVTLRVARFSIISPSPSAMSFVAAPSQNPASQNLVVSNTGVGTLNPDASASADSGGPWLYVIPPLAAGEPTIFRVTINSATLALGTYTGSILLSSATADNSPLSVPVTLTIRAPTPTIALSPTSLSFSATLGTNPAPQTLTVTNSDIGTLDWQASATVGWVTLSPAGGAAPGQVVVKVNTSGLEPGTYATAVTISSSTDNVTNSPQSITVSVTIAAPLAPAGIGVDKTSLTFAANLGANPPAQTVAIANTGGGTLNWSASVSMGTGTNWLSVSPSSGTAPSTLTVSVDVSSLPAGGLYTGTITIGATGATATSQTITVTLALGVPKINPDGVVNAAHQQAAGLSPGGLITIFGTSLASAARPAPPIPYYLPDAIGGTSVKIGAFKAKLLYVSPTQINAQVPADLTGDSAQVTVSVSGLESAPVTLKVLPYDPGLLTFDGTPAGYAAALNSDFTPVTVASPAKPGSVIMLFGTGFGPVSAVVSTGQVGGATVSITLQKPEVQFGGRSVPAASILYSGLVPGVAGVYMVQLQIPADAPTGDNVTVVVGIGGRGTNAAKIAIH